MYDNKTFLCVIPARGGSKGIPGKNITLIKGRPLIDYTIKEALKSKYLDRIIVSTDSESIASISRRCGGEVPFLRPSNLATDESKTIDAVLYTIKRLKQIGHVYDYIVLLQPTQPLRNVSHIDEAIKLIIQKNVNSLVSVSRVKEHPILMRTIDENGCLQGILNRNSTIRRQEFPEYYKVNGSIYINKVDDNLNYDTSLNDNLLPYFMDSKFDLDVDDRFDLEILELKLEYL